MDSLSLALNIFLAVASVVLAWLVVRTFSRAGKERRHLGPWSVVVAFVSIVAGLSLIAFVFFNFTANVLAFSALARAVCFTIFVANAQMALLVLPLVFLELPVNGNLTFRVALVFILVKLGEIIFNETILAYITLPVMLLLFLFTLRVDWGTGRRRTRDLPEDERPIYGTVSVASDDARGIRARNVTPGVFERLNEDPYGINIESDGGSSSAGATTVVTVSAATLIVTLLESILLASLGTGCSEAFLVGLMGLFAVLHGPLCYQALAPRSTFV